MAAETNVITSATPNVGEREDLEDVIYRVSPEKTPLTSNIGSTKATNTYHEWQIETLASASASNAHLEGDEITAMDSPNLPTRVGNTCQILRKTAGVSRTQQIVKLAGRDNELARQKVLKGLELKRDFEMSCIGNNAAVAQSGGTARALGGALAWGTSNVSRGSGGSSGGFSGAPGPAAATNGTQRTFTEALVKGVLATAFGNGGTPSQAYMGPTQKQEFSAFAGIAMIRKDVPGDGMATIVGAADVYVSDFGNLVLIAHPYGLTRDCLLIDPDYWKRATLDGIKTKPLATTGDADKFLMTMEATLVAANEKSSGFIADLQ
jgi:hypothetical protein